MDGLLDGCCPGSGAYISRTARSLPLTKGGLISLQKLNYKVYRFVMAWEDDCCALLATLRVRLAMTLC